MKNKFQITSLDASKFKYLFELSEKELSNVGAKKMIAKTNPGFPCRVSLEDAQVGEEVLLFNYEHHKVNSPYKASGAIFVKYNAQQARLEVNEIPKMLNHRSLSLRGYKSNAMMVEAKTVKGENLRKEIDLILANNSVEYIHVHNSGPGCYNCQINRVK